MKKYGVDRDKNHATQLYHYKQVNEHDFYVFAFRLNWNVLMVFNISLPKMDG